MPDENEFSAIAKAAVQQTKEDLFAELSGLTRLTDVQIDDIITQTGISQQDLTQILKEIKTATKINEATANNIRNINSGVAALAAIVKKFL